jgi:hypothetical protein
VGRPRTPLTGSHGLRRRRRSSALCSRSAWPSLESRLPKLQPMWLNPVSMCTNSPVARAAMPVVNMMTAGSGSSSSGAYPSLTRTARSVGWDLWRACAVSLSDDTRPLQERQAFHLLLYTPRQNHLILIICSEPTFPRVQLTHCGPRSIPGILAARGPLAGAEPVERAHRAREQRSVLTRPWQSGSGSAFALWYPKGDGRRSQVR